MPTPFENPDSNTELLPVADLAERLITHEEIMALAAQRMRVKLKAAFMDESASPTIIAQYSMLANLIDHTLKRNDLSFMDLAVGSGTIAKIAEAVATEVGSGYGRTAEDSNLSRNGSLPAYTNPTQLASSFQGAQRGDQTLPDVTPIDS